MTEVPSLNAQIQSAYIYMFKKQRANHFLCTDNHKLHLTVDSNQSCLDWASSQDTSCGVSATDCRCSAGATGDQKHEQLVTVSITVFTVLIHPKA